VFDTFHSCKEVETDTWHIFNQPASHPCCPDYVTSYHQKIRSLPEECLLEIQKLASTGVFGSEQIQKHLFNTKGWNVATELIYMIGYRARCKMFGGTGNNETLHLKHQQDARRKRGDKYDLHYSESGNLKHIVWVSSFAHLLIQYFDYFLCDGTHSISKYGWKFMPLCIVTSGDWIFPIGAVFGPVEDSESLKLLHESIRQHLKEKNVDSTAFQPYEAFKANVPSSSESASHVRSWSQIFLRNFLYPPEFEECVVMSMIQSWQHHRATMKQSTCENCGILEHNSKWCPLAKRKSITAELSDYDREKVSKYFDFLSHCPISFAEPNVTAAAAAAALKNGLKYPTLHTDGGSAFGMLCKEISRERTACAIHLESKVAACNQDIKRMVSR
jgi:hypothetical protein